MGKPVEGEWLNMETKAIGAERPLPMNLTAEPLEPPWAPHFPFIGPM